MRIQRRGFTLVELMVVIGIIGILMAMLLPAVNQVRIAAKRAATQATLATLDQAIVSFKADSDVGGVLPPSESINTRDPRLSNSSVNLVVPPQGAALLAWALVGADLLGTPGFPDDWRIRTAGGRINDTTKPFYNLYAINDNPALPGYNEPWYTRRGPFVDLTSMRIPEATPDPFNTTLSRYRIPVGDSPMLPWICFLDTFDRPILYYRARRGASAMASACTSADYSDSTGVYELRDNVLFTGISGTPSTHDLGGGKLHPLSINFPTLIRDENVVAKPTPQRADSYLLISAGPDGVYGTGDDVTNFKPNY